MKVLLVDQIAKVNYKYTFPLANGLEKPELKFYWRLTRNRRRKIADVKESICLIQMKRMLESWKRCKIILHPIKKSENFFERKSLMCSIRNGIHFHQSTICF